MDPDDCAPPVPLTERPRRRSVDLRDDGLLWLINRTCFHPRGYALAIDDTCPTGFVLLGNGLEPWRFDLPADVEDELFDRTKTVMP